jgi:hypothetical protein
MNGVGTHKFSGDRYIDKKMIYFIMDTVLLKRII